MIGLKIKNPDNQNLNAFCKFLIPIIKRRALDFSKLDFKLEKLWDEYLEETLSGTLSIIPDVRGIIREYFNHLIVSFSANDNSYTIGVDKNAKYPQTSIPVESLSALLTNGALDVPRYPVFDEIYEDIKLQVPTLYKIWRVT